MMIWSTLREIELRALIAAGLLAAVVSVFLALGAYWLAPWQCDASPWFCLTSLSVLVVAPVAAVGVPVSFHLNLRRLHPLPDGWLPILLATGVLAQILVTACSLVLLAPYLFHAFSFDVLAIPEGFLAGVLVGAVFSVCLAAFSTRRSAAE